MRVLVAGGSGALGRYLCADLAARGHEVVVLTRSPGRGPHREVGWDGKSVGAWASELAGSAVVNLAGELVYRRPTKQNIELFTRSRVESTRALIRAAAVLEEPVPVWLQMSTAAIHGEAGEAELDDYSPPGDWPPQMSDVVRSWEDAGREVTAERLVLMRTGIVLGPGTPAYEWLTRLVRWGLGGRVGSGRQWVSWIHVDDWLAAVRFLLGIDGAPCSLSDVVVVSGPQPVRNAELMAALRTACGRPWSPPTPVPLARLGAAILRTDPDLAVTGRRVLPKRLLGEGFEFAHPRLEEALRDLHGRTAP